MSSSSSGPTLEPALVCQVPAPDLRYVHNVLEVSGWVRGVRSLNVAFASERHEATLGPEDESQRRRPFTARLPVFSSARGAQRLELVALTDGGGRLEEQRTLIAEPFGDPHPPSASALDGGEVTLATGPPELSGLDSRDVPARIQGWCYATAGIDRVRAVLDGAREYDLVFPLVRRDVWRAVGRSDALLSGFELVLDRAECPPGRHSLVVLATTSDGRTVGQAGEFQCVDVPGAGAVGLVPDSLGANPSLASAGASTDSAPMASAAPDALSELLGAVDGGWASWAAPLASGRDVLVLGDELCAPALAHLRRGAASLRAVDAETDLAALPDGGIGLVVIASSLGVDDHRLSELERVLAPAGLLVAVGGSKLLKCVGGRFRYETVWTQAAELHTRLEAAGAGPVTGRALILTGCAPLPELAAVTPEPIRTDLATLAEQHELARLTAVVAERHVLVSALEGGVIALYHRELHRTASRLRAELAERGAELAAERQRAAAAEARVRALTRPSSRDLSSIIRALMRATGRRRD